MRNPLHASCCAFHVTECDGRGDVIDDTPGFHVLGAWSMNIFPASVPPPEKRIQSKYMEGNAREKLLTRAPVNLNHFRLLRVVGRGAFGKVRIVERKDTGLSFALKYIRKDEG